MLRGLAEEEDAFIAPLADAFALESEDVFSESEDYADEDEGILFFCETSEHLGLCGVAWRGGQIEAREADNVSARQERERDQLCYTGEDLPCRRRQHLGRRRR